MSEGAQQVGLDTQGPWLPPNRIPLSRRLSLYFLYAALALSLFGGHVHPSGLLIIVGFVVVFHVATRPLTSDFLVRYPFYLVVLRVLLVVMCAGLVVAFLPAPDSWRAMEQLVTTLAALVVTAGWTVMVMIYLFQARQVRLDTIFSGVAAFFCWPSPGPKPTKCSAISTPTAFTPHLGNGPPHLKWFICGPCTTACPPSPPWASATSCLWAPPPRFYRAWKPRRANCFWRS